MNTKEIQNKLNQLFNEEKVLNEELRKAEGRRLIECEKCGKRSKVSNLTYIQTHFYTLPHGCTDGDYWSQDEGQFICPHCNCINRLYKRPDICKLKDSFKEVVNTYEK